MKKASAILVICFLINLIGSIYTIAATSPLSPIYFENWTVSFNNSGSSYAEGTASIITDEAVAHTGNRCIYLSYPLGKMSNRYMTLKSDTMTFDNSKKYKFSFWLKAAKGSKGVAARIGWNSGRFNVFNDTALADDIDWTYYEFICPTNPNGTQSLLFIIENTCADGIWLDDLMVSECDDEGNAVGQNLLLNPGFESTLPPGEVKDINVQSDIGSMTISWTNPDDADYEKAIIYRETVEQALEIVAELQSPLNTYTISNMSDATPYKYIIKTYDTAGDESEGVEVSGTYFIPRPSAPDVQCDDKNNIIIGIDETMEYKIDDGEWIAYDPLNPPKFPGDCTVSVRVAATDLVPEGAETVLTFTSAFPNVIKDDFNNVIVGIDETMEYKIDDGEWIAYDSLNPPKFSGDCVVQIRHKSDDPSVSEKIRIMTFTRNTNQPTGNEITAEVKYNKGKIIVEGVTPAGEGNKVTLVAYKAGTDIREYKNIFELRQLVSGTNGTFSTQFTMPDVKDNQFTNGDYILYLDGENADKSIPPITFYHRTADKRQEAVEFMIGCTDTDSIKSALAENFDLRPALITIGLPVSEYDSLSDSGKNDFAQLLLERIYTDMDAELFEDVFGESVIIAMLNDGGNMDDIETVLTAYKEVLNLESNDGVTYESLVADGNAEALSWIFERFMSKRDFDSIESIQSVFKEFYLLYLLNQAPYSEIESLISDNVQLLGLADNSEYKKYLSLPDYSNDSNNKSNKLSVNKELVKILNNSPATDVSGFVSAFEDAVATAKNSGNNSSSGSAGGSSGGGSGGGGSSGSVSYIESVKVESSLEKVDTENIVFADINTVPWAKESINALVSQGVISGYPGNIFMPDRNVTREEFVKMLVVAFGLYDVSAECSFSDVPYGEWYYSYIASAQKNGIVEGIDSTSFGVGNEITREQMATITYRAAVYLKIEFDEITEAVKFDDDNEISDYARDAISVMQKAGIINGVGDNKYAPKDTASRAQAAKVIYELLKYLM
jgi:hypothetical protein